MFYICPMKKKILPLSRQSFRKMREDNCIYVDKTKQIYDLCRDGGMYFLSRPRRFGKSVLLSTMAELFKGNKELFTDLWIADKWDWTQTSAVIHISFLTVSYEKQGLEAGLKAYLLAIFAENKIEPINDENIKNLFFDLIKKLHDKHGKVVILIDEYDKAILDYMEFHKMPQAKANQEVLAVFYGALKEADDYIRLFFMTGVSTSTKNSLGYCLNSLQDLTLHPRYGDILGFTQNEIEAYFSDFIDLTQLAMPTYSHFNLLEEIDIWYSGYSWDGKNTLYNPFCIVSFFSNQVFKSYWFQIKQSPVVIQKIVEQRLFQIEHVETTIDFLKQYGFDRLELTSLLFQMGYLAIKEKLEDGILVLSYPNQDVKQAFNLIKSHLNVNFSNYLDHPQILATDLRIFTD